MIRFILRVDRLDAHSDMRTSDLFTIDADVPALESSLTRGGHGPSGFETVQLIGVEIRQQPTETAA